MGAPTAEQGSKPSLSSELRLLKIREVADYLRVSPMTVYRLIRRGNLRATQVGKSYRIKLESLEEMLESSR